MSGGVGGACDTRSFSSTAQFALEERQTDGEAQENNDGYIPNSIPVY